MAFQRTLALMLAILLAGCAGYKELVPDPELSGNERGTYPIVKGEELFQLEKDTKYVMKFPPPAGDSFYLLLTTAAKRDLVATFTSAFDDKPVTAGSIADEAAGNDSTSVYAVNARYPSYFWVIDTVRFDTRLPLRYRYVPQWRYTFETKYAEMLATYGANTVERRTYESIDRRFNFDTFDAEGTLAQIDERSRALEAVNTDLGKIEAVFPPGIAASGDTAYRNWQELHAAVEGELQFQTAYASAIALFRKERETRGSVQKFLEAVPFFVSALGGNTGFSPGVKEKARDVMLARLAGVQIYYQTTIRGKTDLRPIAPAPSRQQLAQLYKACGESMPPALDLAVRFVDRFNLETTALQRAEAKMNELKMLYQKEGRQINEALFTDVLTRATEIKQTLQEPQCATMEVYGTSACAVALAEAVTRTANRTDDLLAMYEEARQVAAALDGRAWARAEASLVDLYEGKNAHDKTAFADHRTLLLQRFESALFLGVKQASIARVDSFVRQHQMSIENVPALYADSAFMPVHQMTFSSAGPNDLLTKRKEIDGYLDRMKHRTLPESAIKAIYADFVRNTGQKGVEKARAVVDHGKMYQGDDQKVKVMVEECDPTVPKWITSAREYRKMFVLPVTTNRQGVNDYVFRIRLQIPTEAQFPVYDINIKLPQELAAGARQAQWYDEITLNKKPVKNEGRFRITAPTAENNYESQITPVQMDKEGVNVLEVKFKNRGFRVFEISAMAQVPIIRKN